LGARRWPDQPGWPRTPVSAPGVGGARRLARSGALVSQITTDGMCHLEVDLVTDKLAGWDLNALDFLFI